MYKRSVLHVQSSFFLLFRLINFFVVLVAVAVQHYTILFFVYVESFAFSPGIYYENLFFFYRCVQSTYGFSAVKHERWLTVWLGHGGASLIQ